MTFGKKSRRSKMRQKKSERRNSPNTHYNPKAVKIYDFNHCISITQMYSITHMMNADITARSATDTHTHTFFLRIWSFTLIDVIKIIKWTTGIHVRKYTMFGKMACNDIFFGVLHIFNIVQTASQARDWQRF